MDADKLSIGDYLTIPIVDLVVHSDFDIGTFSILARLSRVRPSVEHDLMTFVRNGVNWLEV